MSYFEPVSARIVGEFLRPRGMHPDRQIVAVHRLEDRREFRIVERAAVDVGEDLDAARIQRLHRAADLGERVLHVVHADRGDKGGELVRVLRDDLRHAVIGELGKLARRGGRRHVFDRRQREGENLLIVRPELLHHPKARIEIVEDRDIRPAPNRRLVRDDLHHLVEVGLRENMRKNVDLLHVRGLAELSGFQARGTIDQRLWGRKAQILRRRFASRALAC